VKTKNEKGGSGFSIEISDKQADKVHSFTMLCLLTKNVFFFCIGLTLINNLLDFRHGMTTNNINVMENIGRMSFFSAESLGSGRFGTVYPGKFQDFDEEVAIKKMRKKKVQVDSNLYVKTNGQQNIINYYGTEITEQDEFV